MRALVIALMLVAAPAHAGKSHFGWLTGTDVLVERALELQVRITEHDDLGDTRIRDTSLWTGFQIGITDRLELTLPAEMSWFSAVGIEQDFSLRRYGAELRYRFTDASACWGPVARFAILRDVIRRDVIHAELDAAVSFTRGRVYAAAEAGIVADVNRGGLRMQLRPGAGASVLVTGALRLGAELHAELDRDSGATSWIAAGPSIGWTHGRFWIAGTYAFGLSSIGSAPRLVWGVAF